MKTKYQIDDVVYHVVDYKIMKVIIEGVIIKTDRTGTHTIYVISSYNKDGKTRERNATEAFLVDTLDIAKESALTNWTRITAEVRKGIINTTEESFDTIKNEIK